MALWLNEYEIEDASRRWAERVRHPVLGPAAVSLERFMRCINRHSDGWPYWQKGTRPAVRLMELIQGDWPRNAHDDVREDATPEALRKALMPIRSFLKRQGWQDDCTLVMTLEEVDAGG